MKQYAVTVSIIEKYDLVYEVDAKSKSEAIQKAKEWFESGSQTEEHYHLGTEIKNVEINPENNEGLDDEDI